ncbi:enhanced serine sensitivity protein SseB [Gilliamella sp. Pas-s27]|nr:enhanced serine sensitivity protein SseB [Gilliamella sp. Pas-s27]
MLYLSLAFQLDMFIDFIVADTEFGQQAIKDEKPFYQKKRIF